ncbi:MAG: C40 family peptidase [Lachnospiraceae bacterium]|nr:C40 family peptidase [Lachnospiraceae bacterium]
MTNKLYRTFGLLIFCAAFAAFTPEKAQAAGPKEQTASAMLIRVDDMNTSLYSKPADDASVIGQAELGSTYEVLELIDGEWIKIRTEEQEGYLNTVKSATTMAETAKAAAALTAEAKRQEIVAYAKQFVGGRYVYGGTNPHKGVDCSGFTSYVLSNSAGVSLAHSSSTQATQGRQISMAEARPGDLIFYGNGRHINHVAMYIGDGQIIHASNERTGITISSAGYRAPVSVVNVLGD